MITELASICCVATEDCLRNLDSNLARSLPECSPLPERDGKLAVVGSGPSVRDYLDELRSWPGEIWAINGAYDYLVNEGIIPHGMVSCDPMAGLVDYVKHPQPQTTFYVSALCDPSVLDALKDSNVKLWFLEQDNVKYPNGKWVVTGGTTALTRAPFLSWMLGWRDLTIYGADSSFDVNGRYAYADGTYIEDSKAPINWVRTSDGKGPFATEMCLLKQVAQLACIVSIYKGKLAFRCGGLLDAYLRSPETSESVMDHVDAA